jgi:hypothetical protein
MAACLLYDNGVTVMSTSQNGRTFIITMIVLGAIVVMDAAVYWKGSLLTVAAYIVLAALASTLKVRLPGIPGTFSANCLVTVLAITQLSMAQLVVVSVACALIQSRWRAAQPPMPEQVAFNAGVFAISAAASAWVYSWMERLTPAIPGIASLVIASCVFFFIDTGAVSLVMSLTEGMSPLRVWRLWQVWSLPYYLMNVAMVFLIISLVPASVLLVIVFVISITLSPFVAYQWLVRKTASGVVTQVS